MFLARRVGLINSPGEMVKPRSKRLGDLRDLGYLQSSVAENPEDKGVILYRPEAAWKGVNLYTEIGGSAVRLIDMKGDVIHSWSYDRAGDNAIHSEVFSNGDLLMGVVRRELVKLDQDSNVLWKKTMAVHHDFHIADNGKIYALESRAAVAPEAHPTREIAQDFIHVLSPDGETLDEISILQLVLDSPYAGMLPQPNSLEGDKLDILHTNHIEFLDGSLSDRSPLYKRGNILLSVRHLNSALIVDSKTHEIVWLWGANNVIMQHHARLLDNGNILIFDNGWEQSRIVEVNPLTRLIEWEYSAGEDFFSSWGGSNQRLPNGNTLITETERGMAFEVTPEGEKVWEFANPHFDSSGKERFNIWRMERLDPKTLEFL